MTISLLDPTIPESFLEHRQVFRDAWVDQWSIPNPFIGRLFPLLKDSGVELTDFSFNKEAKTVGESYLNIAVRKINSAIRIGLDHIVFIVANPDWGMAPQLVLLFDSVSTSIQDIVGRSPQSQEMTLAFHVTPGTIDLQKKTASLVSSEVANDSLFCGISLHYGHSSLVIDKSLRYEGAAFIRLQRVFEGSLSFAEMAPQLYEDELKALNLLGITGVI